MVSQAFREAEEASERRLEEEEEEDEEESAPPAPLSAIAGNLSALGAAKKRRRGSISISRVGTVRTFLLQYSHQTHLRAPTVWVFNLNFHLADDVLLLLE